MSRRDEDLREHRSVLVDYERDYRDYVSALIHERESGTRLYDERIMQAKRTALVRRAARAGRALDASGVGLRMRPPDLFGGPVLTDLVSQVMAHETTTYGSGRDPLEMPKKVLDGLVTAIGALEDQAAQAEAKKPAGSSREPRVREVRWPTLVGRLRHVPRGIGMIADLGGAVVVVAGLGKFVGVW